MKYHELYNRHNYHHTKLYKEVWDLQERKELRSFVTGDDFKQEQVIEDCYKKRVNLSNNLRYTRDA